MTRRPQLLTPLIFCIITCCPFAGLSQLSNCSNWLYLPSNPSLVSIGDLDITGHAVTVEALYMRTVDYSGTDFFAGDVVSKHFDNKDVNYLLRPSHCEITTTTGFHRTPEICRLEVGKVYHIAMVYDGTTLKFYRNGFLMSQVPATGDLILNDWNARIGLYSGGVSTFQFIGYINEVRIWNVARTQAEICENMQISLPSPATQPGLQAYYTFDNLLNKQGNSAWNGSLVGSAQINQINPGCPNFVADSCGATITSGFEYGLNVCYPFTINFSSSGNRAGNWSFGDGQTAIGTAGASHTYAAPADYTVSFSTLSGGCWRTTSKLVRVHVVPEDIITTANTTICLGSSKQLSAKAAEYYCWTPVTYLDDPASPNPTTSTPQDITYFLTALVHGNNLVVNGDFSAGNSGFTSEYLQTVTNTAAGQYTIGGNPKLWNAALSTCTDHTSGNGNMMIANGAGNTVKEVWRQTVTVTPNSTYLFTSFVEATWPANPAQLQLAVDGTPIGSPIAVALPVCGWSKLSATWNSDAASTAVISIIYRNLQPQDNHFAIDDISFEEVQIKRDSVKINVDKPLVKANDDITICKGTPIQLHATGADIFVWTPADGLSDATIANPMANPISTTEYIVTGTDASGCAAKDTVKINVQPLPEFTISGNEAICEGSTVTLHAKGGSSYSWSPAATLDDGASADPVARPTSTTEYAVDIREDVCNYDTTLHVTVTVNPNPEVTAQKSNDISCSTPTTRLLASGALNYHWTPAAVMDDPERRDPIASIDTTTLFTVVGVDNNGCKSTDTISVFASHADKPVFALPNAFSPNNDGRNDCFGIRQWGTVTLLEFSIYNRFGEKIFSTTNPSQCWDGTYKGHNSDTGTYVYVIRARSSCGDVKRTGVVLLVR